MIRNPSPLGIFLRRALRACLLGVSSVACNAHACDSSADDFNLEEVAPGVFVHQGRHVGIDDATRGDSANIGFVVGKDCVAVIDTGGSLATGQALRAQIKSRTHTPICFVINTHAHFDHVLGNAAFVGDHPQFVGHANLAAVLAASREYFLERFGVELQGAPAPQIIAPDLAVVADQALDLGARSLRLVAHPVAHSTADLTVLDLATSTLWAGDLLFVERLPVLDGQLKGWQDWMDKAAGETYAQVIPGHGPRVVHWPSALGAQQRYLTSLSATVATALQKGTFLEEVMAAGVHADLDEWQVPGAHARNLSKVYREMEWQ